VQGTCILSATALSFGTYTGLAASGTSAVRVTCTNTTPYTVALSAGLGTGATTSLRKMTRSASAVLTYGLYQNATFSQNFGNTSGTDTYAGSATGAVQTLTVYGQIPASEYVVPGAYTDSITATVTY
jgi:spore coat protein U-like protein